MCRVHMLHFPVLRCSRQMHQRMCWLQAFSETLPQPLTRQQQGFFKSAVWYDVPNVPGANALPAVVRDEVCRHRSLLGLQPDERLTHDWLEDRTTAGRTEALLKHAGYINMSLEVWGARTFKIVPLGRGGLVSLQFDNTSLLCLRKVRTCVMCHCCSMCVCVCVCVSVCVVPFKPPSFNEHHTKQCVWSVWCFCSVVTGAQSQFD